MLGDEDRVTAIRSLFAVVARFGWREPFFDQLTRLLTNRSEALALQDGTISAVEMKLCPESVLTDSFQACVQLVHQVGFRCSTVSANRRLSRWAISAR